MYIVSRTNIYVIILLYNQTNPPFQMNLSDLQLPSIPGITQITTYELLNFFISNEKENSVYLTS